MSWTNCCKGLCPRSRASALSARVIAGGEGGDPRAARGGGGGPRRLPPKHMVCKEHHLTLPLLRNGPHPLPRCAAERDLRRARHAPWDHAVIVRMNTGSRVPGLIENTASEWTMLPTSSVVKMLVTPL